MKTFANSQAWLGVVAAAGLALGAAPAAMAQNTTAQALIDRQQILDHITRYYYNFGKNTKDNEADFYADDAVLILGTREYKGKEGIMNAYRRPPPAAAAATAASGAGPAAGAAPLPAVAPAAGAAAAAAAAPAEKTAFNVVIDNPLIIVHGDTATSQVIFTEYRQEKKGDPMKMTTQGKEYATFVKVKGKWLYKTRQIASGSEPPAGWKE